MTTRLRFIALLCILVGAGRASAQRPDSAQCRALLAQPVRDSLTVTVGLSVRAFDSTKVIGPQRRADLVSAVRGVLQLPRPLPLLMYSIEQPRGRRGSLDSGTVMPTIAGAYAGEIWPDGHLANLRVTGGGRVAAFDNALLGALKLVSDSSLLPPLPGGGRKPIELRMQVAPIDDEPSSDTADSSDTSTPFEPLFRMRVPVLGLGKPVALEPGTAGPRYPEEARRANVEGMVRLRFVVNADGRADPGSIQVRAATARDFVSATLDAFHSFRFTPLEFRGCPIASLVEMPFEFRLRRE